MLSESKTFSTRIKTILVVEDDGDMSEVMYMTLSEEPSFHPIIINSAFEALELAPRIMPDLFILDYLLAGMNGIELYDRLHATPGLEKIPTIITSASLYVHRLQIDDRHLTGLEKPFDLDILLQTVKQVVG
ncbi:response regulator [Tengunoibacter tsumagoiensis]|uniref:Response regulatory domain-containing protein n=1 Tax=Tengunoibacter tsumagoiensis TaxID=2014871 RepID=A0A401ZVI6_9CHLR|nr:response regulator [Tengunoibacter tsumagoiensis]GCE10938.1 hypothetical protein KTT_07970 [Tengunoibacter tsumagoiensis]